MIELRIIRKATEIDLAGARRGAKSMFDALIPQLTDEWVVVFEGDPDKAKRVASNDAAKRRGIQLKVSNGLVLARKAPEPMGLADAKPKLSAPTIVPSPNVVRAPHAQWTRPEGVPPVPWSDLRPKDRERCAAAIDRITGMAERAAAIADLQVSNADVAATVKDMRKRGLL